MSDPLNSDDPDASKVAAALADAAHAGGLSEAYYREADAALRRLWSRAERLALEVTSLRREPGDPA